MRAYKGLVQNGKIILAEGVDLPDGTVVTVTVGEAELLRAKLRSALKRNVRRRSKGGLRIRGMPTLT
jgi:hypothetical protein